MTATLTQFPLFHAEKDGKPLSAGKVYTYQSWTTIPLATYQDQAQTIINTNPVILDADGNAEIRLQEEYAYTIVVRDSAGALVSTTDDVRASVTSSAASGYVKKSGAGQTVSSEITFTASPKVPTPTADSDAANKAFVIGSVPQGIQGESRNLKIDYTGTGHAFTLTADAITIKNAADAYRTLRNVSLTIDASTTGANGLESGSVAASTWYYVFVIWNETTIAGLVSTSRSPTLPSGYTYSARVGAFYSDATNKYPLSGYQRGSEFSYLVRAGSNLSSSFPIIASGVIGSISTPTYVSSGLTSFIPDTARSVIIAAENNTSTLMIAHADGYGPANGTNIPTYWTSHGSASTSHVFNMPLLNQNIWIASAGANNKVRCAGWIDS